MIMDLRESLYEATNVFLEDEHEEELEPVDLDDIENDIDVPAYLRKKAEREEEPEADADDIEVPAFKRHPQRTDYKTPEKLSPFRKEDPMENVPEDDEVPKFLRDRGAKVFPDDIEKPAFARKKSEEIAKELGAELKRPK
jgi:hypothetical protein